jgi:polysaccharide export outer membrane protein
MIKIRFHFFFLACLLQLYSCKTREKLVYFQNSVNDSVTSSFSNYTPIFKSDDFLSIIVTGEELDAVTPFNLPVAGMPQSVNNGYTMGNPAPYGYLIDANGMVVMPFIGEVKLEGLNRMEAIRLIENKLSEYLKNPVVQIQILNYKVTVLGDVRSPGTYKIPNERITLLEAIGLAGDLKMTGQRTNVLVIRDVNGKKTEFRIDLTSKDLFSSPVYYLSQNDVVYVEPNVTARTESTIWRTTGPIFISLTSLVVTTITLLTR